MGWIWMVAGVLLALLAGFMTFRTLSTAATRAALEGESIPTTPVVVANRTIPINYAIGASDISLRNMPTDLVPSGAVTTLESALGRISRTELATGEVLLQQRLIEPDKVIEDALAFAIPEGYVAMALPAIDLFSSLGLLQAGDKVDFLVSLEIPGAPAAEGQADTATTAGQQDTSLVTIDAMPSMEITALVIGALPEASAEGSVEQSASGEEDSQGPMALNAPQAMIFALRPQDALILKHVIDAGGIIDLALRGPNDDQFIETDPVSLRYLSELYRMDVLVQPEPREGQ